MTAETVIHITPQFLQTDIFREAARARRDPMYPYAGCESRTYCDRLKADPVQPAYYQLHDVSVICALCLSSGPLQLLSGKERIREIPTSFFYSTLPYQASLPLHNSPICRASSLRHCGSLILESIHAYRDDFSRFGRGHFGNKKPV